MRKLYGERISQKSIVDLGALEGAYALEFAKLGMDTLGIEIRQTNIDRCNLLPQMFALPNLRFALDDCWNIGQYGPFDAVFCSGLLYHLDRPVEFIRLLAENTRDIVFLQTHFAPEETSRKFVLGEIQQHEGMPGRWYREHDSDNVSEIETYRLSSFHNKKSFWLTRPAILQVLKDSGFDVVLEQHDALGDGILSSLTEGYFKNNHRAMFVGIKSHSNV